MTNTKAIYNCEIWNTDKGEYEQGRFRVEHARLPGAPDVQTVEGFVWRGSKFDKTLVATGRFFTTVPEANYAVLGGPTPGSWKHGV